MALTRDDVLSVIGPADETLVTEIIATKATTEELTHAWAWANNDEALINEGRPLPSGRNWSNFSPRMTRKNEPYSDRVRRIYNCAMPTASPPRGVS
jgi:hypothetical protein